MLDPWSLWWKTARLTLDAQAVVALRIMKAARGGEAAHRENQLMVAEKIAALPRAAFDLATGVPPGRVIGRLGREVRANRRRLSK